MLNSKPRECIPQMDKRNLKSRLRQRISLTDYVGGKTFTKTNHRKRMITTKYKERYVTTHPLLRIEKQ